MSSLTKPMDKVQRTVWTESIHWMKGPNQEVIPEKLNLCSDMWRWKIWNLNIWPENKRKCKSLSLNLPLRGVAMKASRKKKNAWIKTRISIKDGGLDPGGLTTKSWDHQRILENNDLLYKSVAAPEDWKINSYSGSHSWSPCDVNNNNRRKV